MRIHGIVLVFGLYSLYYAKSCPTVELISDEWTGFIQFYYQNYDGFKIDLVFPENNSFHHEEVNKIVLRKDEFPDIQIMSTFDDNKNVMVNEVLFNNKPICVNNLRESKIGYNLGASLKVPFINTVSPTFAHTVAPTVSPQLIQEIVSVSGHQTNSHQKHTECGTVIPDIKPLIINGKKSYSGQFPWHAALFYLSETKFSYICGGSLLSKNVILTAAHCVTILGSTNQINHENLTVVLGKYILNEYSTKEQSFNVNEIIVHPDFDSDTFYSDIAILKLEKNYEYSIYISPICLDERQGLRSVVTRIGLVPGWGFNEHERLADELSYISMPVVTYEQCIWSNPNFYGRFTSDKSFCAGFRNGDASVCYGDSGGGMIFYEKSKWFIRGIVSISLSQFGQGKKCDPREYVVFTDVTKFVPWIKFYF